MFHLIFIFSFLIYSSYRANDIIDVCYKNCIFINIQDAINKSKPNSKIYIHDGIYNLEQEILIEKPIQLIAKDSNFQVILDAHQKQNVIYIKNTENVEISGLTLKNAGYSDIKEYAGIYAENSKNCKFLNNKIQDSTYGIYLARTHNSLIQKNQILANFKKEVQSGNGIHIWNGHFNILEENFIEGHRDGIYFEYSQDLKVIKNISQKNLRYGIHFMFCHNSHITENKFIYNPTGTALMYSRSLILLENEFSHSFGNSFMGMLLKEIDQSVIKNNLFYRNTTAIYFENSNRNQIETNQFIKNSIALEVMGNSYYNQFTNNKFKENLFDVFTNSKANENVYTKNFWDKYKGYDLNKDGLGDVPYKPVSLFGFWVSKNPSLAVLIKSPIVEFLELLERVFPSLSPENLQDESPLMREINK